MRKVLVVVLVLLCLASIYIFIPNQIMVSEVEEVESSERIIAKYLNSNENRQKWWPSSKQILDSTGLQSSVLDYEGYKFDFRNSNYNFNEVLIINNSLKINSIITWDLSTKNLIRIRWKVSIPTSYNPVTRVFQYLRAHRLKSHMALIMESFLGFIVNSKNVYGFHFEREIVQDTILATSNTISTSYPKTLEVYNRINSIKKYLREQGANQVNPAMLNISKSEQGAFQLIIAVPINRIIPPVQGILINRMVPGNIVVAQIKGGPHSVAKGFNQMNLYLKDFKLVSPAMPFQSLITDRVDEPDTSKWITKIYYPIF